MAYSRFLCFSLGFVLLFHVCFAQTEHRQRQQQPRRQCSLNNLNALEPTRKIQAEAGYSELWNNNEEQLQCAGVNVVRHVIQPKGLLLPFYTNAHKLFYIIEGRAIHGALMSGCPETYQSESESSDRSMRQNPRDQHQKIRQLREGDVVALHAGVAHWLYNNGNNRLVILTVEYVSQADNQLDENIRNFFLAGNPQESQRQSEGQTRQSQNSGNVFRGFDDEIISESFNIERNLARRLRGEDDKRGHIIQVQEELRLLTPESQEEERQSERYLGGNGLEETLCTMRIKQNINDPKHADVYNPNGGRITTVNSLNLPILHLLQLSAERGVLYNNAILAPQWNLNSHSVVYITRGNGRIQIVGESGQAAFNGNVQQGQLIVVPQNFAVVKRAGRQGIEWIAVKTNDIAVTNQLAGRVSAIRSIPEQVLMNSYRISREEVRRLKQNRQEMTVFGPNSRPQRYSA